MRTMRVLLIVLVIFSIIESRRRRRDKKKNRPEIDENGDVVYDYNLQVLEIPGVVCRYKNCKEEYLGEMPTDAINYHGVWPDKVDGNHPFYCSDEKYNPSKVDDDVYEIMQRNWVGLFNSTYWFRFHEYTKHGTCFTIPSWMKQTVKTQKQFTKEPIRFNVVSQKSNSLVDQKSNNIVNSTSTSKTGNYWATLFSEKNKKRFIKLFNWFKDKFTKQPRFKQQQNVVQKQMNYEDNHQDLFFKAAEEMYARSKMREGLFRKSKTEETVWTVEELKDMIYEQMRVRSYSMMCHYDRHERKSYLQEFRFCWTKESLKPIDCPGGYRSTCRKSDDIYVVPYNKQDFLKK